jgi:nucleotide-binding universal stress UspA family protein
MHAMERFIGTLALPRERTWRSVTRGYPPKVIVDVETEVGAQLVALGKHAAGLVEQVLVGSVALQVLERAQCDVLVVPAA